jgi:hypothetical protein
MLREAKASVALDGDTNSLEGDKAELIRERDRKRKQRDRDRAKKNYYKNKDGLPPMKPINGGGKRVLASEVACPTCNAKAGDPCLRLTSRGKYGVPLVPHVEATHYHHPRVAAAKEARADRQAKKDRADAIFAQAKRAEAGEE